MTNNYEDNDFREQEVLSEDEIKERQEKKELRANTTAIIRMIIITAQITIITAMAIVMPLTKE